MPAAGRDEARLGDLTAKATWTGDLREPGASQVLAEATARELLETDAPVPMRLIAGSAPKLPTGLDPAHIAAVICDGIEGGARDLPPDAFAEPARAAGA